MGCAKNVVDSEKLLAQLRLSNIELAPTIDQADVAVVNTCGFIGQAKEESVDALVEQVRRKSDGLLKKVFAMGCLTERYRQDLAKELPELDGIFGSNELGDVLRSLGAEYRSHLLGERVLTTPSHYAFLKISEGCDNPCSFCAIPLMRGGHRSRPEREILEEAELLVARGVKELIIIGQDTTYYGLDTEGRRRLPRLLEHLADLRGLRWLRLMYAYPAKFPLEVLDVIAGHPKICSYLDMPLQHVSDAVLRSMRRGLSSHALRDLLGRIRERVPEIALRTTLIVGYPAEGRREFDELLGFVEEFRFDRLGAFTYSQEEGTAAHELGDPVPADEKESRRARLMELQREISLAGNERLIGTRQTVLIDREEAGQYFGRTERDAPEVDNEVIVHARRTLAPGEFVEVDIVDAYEYDIVGEHVDAHTETESS